jgi:tetratricopeptide (TPR) repeat protein
LRTITYASLLALLAGTLTPAATPAAAGRESPVAPRGASAAAPPTPVPAELDRLEAALLAAPGDLLLASDYRQLARQGGEHDRALAFFARLVAAHPDAAGAWLNYGYAYVDKIPRAGAVTRVLLANEALAHFDRSIALERSWLALYTRGSSYLYWPKVFGRAPLAVADLEEAVAIARRAPRLPVHSRSWLALGDAYFRADQPERARATWREGQELFPGELGFAERLRREDVEVDRYLYALLDPNLPVDTDLTPLFAVPARDGEAGAG